MNNFAGIITRHPAAAADDYLRQVQQRFPKRYARMNPISGPHMQAAGSFAASALNRELPEQLLFLDGEIFNLDELIRMTGGNGNGPADAATVLHRLILDRGTDALAFVNGQFLVLYADARAQTIHLLCDQSGVQQVFCHEGNGFFLFASDIKFLTAHPQCPSEIDWESSLRRPYPHTVLSSFRSYATWLKGIRLLPEAADCAVLYGEQKVLQRRFWNGLQDYTMPLANDKRNATDIMDEYMALLDDAVKIRTQDSDTASSFLSGGLDSSAICALAARHKPLDSYSIINQTTCIEDTTAVCHDLARDLHFSNKQFLIPYHELTFDKLRWKQRVWRTESPVNHTDALTKNLLHYAIGSLAPATPYVLTGTGSDQYNGGLVRWVVNDEDTEQQSAAAFLDKIKDSEAGKLVSRDEEGFWRIRKLLQPEFLTRQAGRSTERNYWMHYVQSALHVETYSLLWDELRAASAHGRSVRFPFLDHRFAAFIAAVPEQLHAALFYDKQILRKPSGKILPAYVTEKGKAPSFYPGYDFRPRLYDFLTSGADSLLEEAFGSGAHPVIDVPQLRERVAAMKRKPDPVEWQELMQLINLGLLEQLGSKTEEDLDFEQALDMPQLIRFDDPAATRRQLQQRLSVKTDEELLALPLQFGAGCALLQDFKKGIFFLAKNNTLAYEIDDSYADWLKLLQSIDGAQSTQQLLDAMGTGFESVREFFMLALKEQILCLGEASFLVQENK